MFVNMLVYMYRQVGGGDIQHLTHVCKYVCVYACIHMFVNMLVYMYIQVGGGDIQHPYTLNPQP